MATFGPQIIMPKRREPACKFIETQARILSVQGNTQCWKPTYSEALKKRNIIMIVFCSILWQVRRYRWLQFPIDRVRFRHFFSVFLVKLTWLYFHWSNSMNKLLLQIIILHLPKSEQKFAYLIRAKSARNNNIHHVNMDGC